MYGVQSTLHCVVTRRFLDNKGNNEYRDCVIKLAYIGLGVYKEIAPLKVGSDETEQVEEDLAGTGLLEEDSSDSEQNPDVTDSREHDFDSADNDENHNQTNVSNGDAHVSQLDVSDGSHVDVSNEDQGFNDSTDSLDEESHKQSHKQSTDDIQKTGEEALDLTVNDDGYDSDLQITGVSIPDKPNPTIVGCVHRSRSYQCYICSFKSKMQVTFIDHFKTDHKGSPYQCDFCSAPFDSANGLFKHERSHQYMRYRCDLCGHRTQFPYQMKAHQKTHSCEGLIKCELCDKHFASESSKNVHQNIHTTKITCDQCPEKKDQKCSHLQMHLRSTYEANMVRAGQYPVGSISSGSPNICITLTMSVQRARRL